MPCNSDYLRQTEYEIEIQNTAKLLRTTIKRLELQPNAKIKAKINKIANDMYPSTEEGDFVVSNLCKIIKDLEDDVKEKLMYNAHSKFSRALADWWDTHDAADKARIAEEKKEKRRKILAKKAMAKLSDAEIEALGIEDD